MVITMLFFPISYVFRNVNYKKAGETKKLRQGRKQPETVQRKQPETT